MNEEDTKHQITSRFIKTPEEDRSLKDRPRLDFSAIDSFSPDLARRTLLIRSRVKDLRGKLQRDASRALLIFNALTIGTLLLAAVGVIIGVKYPDALNVVKASLAVSVIAGLLAAGSKAFGLHQRYRALFRAGWAMTALDAAIDQELHTIALDLLPDGGDLSDTDRVRLGKTVAGWNSALHAALLVFGDSYGAALSAIELHKPTEKG